MNESLKNAFWEELKLLQRIMDKIDNFTFQIKNWFLGIFAALIAYAVVNDTTALVILSFPLIALFYFYELTYRVTQEDILSRIRDVQQHLRSDEEPNQSEYPPFIDKYIVMESIATNSERLLKVQERFGVEKQRARRNLREWNKMFLEAPRFLLQFRVSGPYLGAFIVAILALLLSY